MKIFDAKNFYIFHPVIFSFGTPYNIATVDHTAAAELNLLKLLKMVLDPLNNFLDLLFY
jgi:hypothetical protein